MLFGFIKAFALLLWPWRSRMAILAEATSISGGLVVLSQIISETMRFPPGFRNRLHADTPAPKPML